MTEHSKEPIERRFTVCDADGRLVLGIAPYNITEEEAIRRISAAINSCRDIVTIDSVSMAIGEPARRIIACVNACAGVPTKYLEGNKIDYLIEDGRLVLSASISDLELFAMTHLQDRGYTVTPPSRSDMSDKVSRSMG